MATTGQRIDFPGSQGTKLAARLDLPAGSVRAYALFAHCFTCSKDLFAAKRIATELAKRGIAVLRFDFTGLGSSEGEFANTTFSSNIGDLLAAAEFLRDRFGAPEILIGHSLGGAAVLAAGAEIPEVKAIATIGAPADADHVIHNFAADLGRIERDGVANVTLAGRSFTIKKQFIDDLATQKVRARVAGLKRALMVLHSPTDNTVGIDNARLIFEAAKHPKSFVSLDTADHLVSRHEDAVYVAEIVAAWSSRFVAPIPQDEAARTDAVVVAETGESKFQAIVNAGRHRLFADEPESVGGLDSGPAPYDFLAAALGACTSMTLRMYATFKKIDLPRVTVEVIHGKVHVDDCADCAQEALEGKTGKIDRFERILHFAEPLDDDLRAKALEIADKCPVHRTLEKGAAVVTKVG